MNVLRCESKEELGLLAAEHVQEKITELLKRQTWIRMVFAAAPSQNEFLYNLTLSPEIEWGRIIAFQMDEYIGLPESASQLFQSYLRDHLFAFAPFKRVEVIRPTVLNNLEECARYGMLVKEAPIDIICMGIGENGHIAFNDPGVADFDDKEVMKVVELDESCRNQQVNDGCFTDLESVPRSAFTLTIPTLLSGKHLFVIVPGSRKAGAVLMTLKAPVDRECPASILRTHSDATLFIDKDSGRFLGSTHQN